MYKTGLHAHLRVKLASPVGKIEQNITQVFPRRRSTPPAQTQLAGRLTPPSSHNVNT